MAKRTWSERWRAFHQPRSASGLAGGKSRHPVRPGGNDGLIGVYKLNGGLKAAATKVKKPELTRQLFQLLNSPDKGQKFILVTGSKGKGSTSRMISSLLGHLGYKVGLFTSPHLVHFNERIRIGKRRKWIGNIPDGGITF